MPLPDLGGAPSGGRNFGTTPVLLPSITGIPDPARVWHVNDTQIRLESRPFEESRLNKLQQRRFLRAIMHFMDSKIGENKMNWMISMLLWNQRNSMTRFWRLRPTSKLSSYFVGQALRSSSKDYLAMGYKCWRPCRIRMWNTKFKRLLRWHETGNRYLSKVATAAPVAFRCTSPLLICYLHLHPLFGLYHQEGFWCLFCDLPWTAQVVILVNNVVNTWWSSW